MMHVIENPYLGWLAAIIQQLPFAIDWDNGPWVAGGAVRRFMANETLDGADIDVFFKDLAQANAAVAAIEQWGPEFADFGLVSCNEPFLVTAWSTFYTLKTGLKVNLVHSKFFENAEAVIDSFDFVHCQFITDGKQIGHTEKAPAASGEKQLRFRQTDSVPATLRRALKYAAQGFTATDVEIGNFLLSNLSSDALLNVRDSTS